MLANVPMPPCDCRYRSPVQMMRGLRAAPPWNASRISVRPDGLCDVWTLEAPTQDNPSGVEVYSGAYDCPEGYGPVEGPQPPPLTTPTLVPKSEPVSAVTPGGSAPATASGGGSAVASGGGDEVITEGAGLVAPTGGTPGEAAKPFPWLTLALIGGAIVLGG